MESLKFSNLLTSTALHGGCNVNSTHSE
jgi:hypothetical protein